MKYSITMNKMKGANSYTIDTVSEITKVIRAGKNLNQRQAVKIAFPDAKSFESFGFTIIGNDLQIRKYHFT